MTTHRIAAEATMAWDAGHRRRRASAGMERCIDAVMASGGLLMVNAAGSLNLGLPEGRMGISLGGALLAAGVAHIARRRRPTRAPIQVAPSLGYAYAPTSARKAIRVATARASHHAA